MDINPESIYCFLNTRASASIAGFLILIISSLAIYYHRKTAKQTATLDFLNRLETDDHLIDCARFLKKCHYDEETDLESIGSDVEKYKSIQEKIDPILNYFEALAIGIKIGIYEKKTACLFRKQQIIHTFDYSEKYIEVTRKEFDNDKLFVNLEWLAKCLSTPKYKRWPCPISKRFK